MDDLYVFLCDTSVFEPRIMSVLKSEAILLQYHVTSLQVDDREVSYMLDCQGFHDHQQLVDLDFNPRALPLRELPCYVLRMFTDLGFDKTYVQFTFI